MDSNFHGGVGNLACMMGRSGMSSVFVSHDAGLIFLAFHFFSFRSYLVVDPGNV